MSGIVINKIHRPHRLTFHGEKDAKIVIVYDSEKNVWDMEMVGDYTTAMETLKRYLLRTLPVCSCMKDKK